MRCDEKVAVVTGAAQGIGEAIARRLAKEGIKVVVADYNLQLARRCVEQMVKDLDSVPTPEARFVDVTDSAAVSDLVSSVIASYGRLDILINNAGRQLNKESSQLTDAEWSQMMAVNLNGAFYCAREAGKQMMAQGSGIIVSITSIAEKFGLARRLPYCVAKAAVSAMTRTLAAEWSPYGIRVNAVAPGYVWTELTRHGLAQGHFDQQVIEGKIPKARWAEPREIAEAVLYLCSDAASYVAGQTLFVDGGYSITK